MLRDFDFWKNFDGSFYGFDSIDLLRNHTCESWFGQHYAMWLQDKGLKNWKDYFAMPVGKMLYRQYGTWIAERSEALLEEYKNKNEPFFLWASFPDPHNPQLVPKPWDTMYDPNDIELPPFDIEEHDNNQPYFREVLKRSPHLNSYRETGKTVHGLWKHKYKPKKLKKQIANV